MMNFPNSPSDGQIVTQTNGVTYRWNLAKTRWDAVVNQTQQVVAVGMVAAFAEAVSDADWLFCDGSAVSRSTYAVLFAKIGVMYGAGNGSTTFNLPDYRGEFLRGQDAGAGTDPDAAGRADRGDGVGGDAVGTLQLSENLSHSHGSGVAVPGSGVGGDGGQWVTGLGPTQASGGSESRPVNTYVRYYIFAGATMGVQSLAGTVVQMKYSFHPNYMSGTTNASTVWDSVMQQSEGTQFMSQLFTPKYINSILKIDVCYQLTNTLINTVVVGLFKDGDAATLGQQSFRVTEAGSQFTGSFTVMFNVTSLAQIDFKFRAGGRFGGAGSNTTEFNGRAGTPINGGKTASSIIITEFAQ